MKRRVVIIGAGLGGCVAAYALTPANDVTIIELGKCVSDMQDRVVDVARPAGYSPHVGAGLGGGTALWHNALIEIDEEVFRKSWPFPKSDLSPWYEAAYPLLGEEAHDKTERLAQIILDNYRKTGVRADLFQVQYIPQKRRNLWESLGLRERVTVLTGAAYRFRMQGLAIRSVVVTTDAGETEVEGDCFVLAAGGLGTPVLLQSLAEEVAVPSLRNAGRFYEDHPQTFIGRARIPAPIYRFWNYPAKEGNLRVLAVLRHDDLDVSFQLRPASLRLWEDRGSRMGSVLTKLRNQMWNPINWLKLLFFWDDVLDIISFKFGIQFPTSHYSIFMQAGQPQSDGSAVSGAFHAVDGRCIIQRNWLMSREYIASLQSAIDNFTTGLHPIARSVSILPDWPDRLNSAAHHSSTARMSRAPEEGVCDPHGRVHGIDNLYVADGSAIPGSGVANTGLTIAALALRLADHLQKGWAQPGCHVC